MPKTDLDTLQGDWTVTSLDADGQRMPAAALAGARVVVKGRRFTSVGMSATYEGTVKLDQTKTPRHFDLVFTAGPEKGARNLGIYKLAGGRWTICLATRGSVRPKTFAAPAGTGFALETLARGAAAGKAATKAPAAKGATTKAGKATTKAGTVAAARAEAEAGPPTPLEGDWAMVSGVFSGAPLDPTMVTWCRRVTRGGLTTVVAGPQTMLAARFTLDTATTPHEVDYMNVEGPNAGQAQAGIFDLRGDTLRVCMAAPGKPRPADFSSKAGDGRSYTTWKGASSSTR
jgi:uncharacterized protein (TIGR03067 family)